MRVSINKLTGKMIESQSGGETQDHLNTLFQNALSAGYKAEDIEVKFVTNEEFQILSKETEPEPTYLDLRKAEYPSMDEQLDAIWEGGSDFDKMKTEINKIQAKYPKAEIG